jgi:alkyl sulfatase BDS1-like metallo-beta-lactamase superfamily hydrolase
MNQLVLADPANRAARELGADALEQLGYQAEAGTWRNAYLYGAQELRNGVMKIPVGNTLNADTLKAVSTEMFFDFLGVRLNAQKAEGKTLIVNWNFTEPRQQFVLNLENSALTHVIGKQSDKADATLTLARSTLDAVTLRKMAFPEAVQAGLIKIEGDPTKLIELLGMLDTFNPMFEVVEPRRAAQP